MRSLAAPSVTDLPAFLAGRFPQDELHTRLHRLTALLGIAGARLSNVAADGQVPFAAVGSADIASLEARALTAEPALVLADSAVVGARFYVGMVLAGDSERPPVLLSLFDARPRSQQMAERIAALAQEMLAGITISQQSRTIKAQAERIAALQAEAQLRRQLFDRASATAKIGLWQCDLADNAIAWTNSIYDLFEMPRGSPITRETTLARYTASSRLQMETARAEAIRSCTDFALDVEVITATGKPRWMRLTGTVESQDGVAKRIFGMKQDITDEKLMADRMRYLAECDVMTGLANRSLFQTQLTQLDAAPGAVGSLLLVDLDGFKQINDTHGHVLGDECLKEAAQRLHETCQDADLVARIGGDEFAVLLAPGLTPDAVTALAQDIVSAIGRPVTRLGQTISSLGASVGVAHYYGGPSADLFRQADTALYAAKAAGRATFRVFAT